MDPPPIVELKIFEETDAEPRDVTFSLNANYFLFATLEQARHIAPGRMHDDAGRLTVLTGTPVSGMVLLDRPQPAGYFIFPDLSVRHEGKYRLSFSLYEELKNPQDEDQTDEPNKPPGDAHVTHRLEVKSTPFTVFSAKKFPGLTESTNLSRVVAEQGCRVRIRRDVRMRRRDQKGAKDWDGYEDDTAEARARMSATPDNGGYQVLPPPHPYMDPISRPRSSSNASHHSLAPSLHRRPSQDVGSAYSQPGYGTAPHTPPTAYPQTSPYGPSPTHYATGPYVQQQPSMQPPPPQYQQPAYQQPPAASSQPNYYGYGSVSGPSQSQVAPGAQAYESHERHSRTSMDSTMQMPTDNRRSSMGYAPPPPPPPAQTGYAPRYSYPGEMGGQSSYAPSPQASYLSQSTHTPSYPPPDQYPGRVGPPEPVQPPTRASIATPPITARPFANNQSLPPINTTLDMISKKNLEPASPASAGQQGYGYNTTQATYESPHKRGYGQVFSNHHVDQPLRQGARPSTNGGRFDTYYGSEVEADPNSLDPVKMVYRRSDGSQVERAMPVHPTAY